METRASVKALAAGPPRQEGVPLQCDHAEPSQRHPAGHVPGRSLHSYTLRLNVG